MLRILIPLMLFAGSWLIGAASNAPLKVMSFNIRYGTANDGPNSWAYRKDLVALAIQVEDPDLLGVQECLKSQADFLEALLPTHGFHGVGRDDGQQGGEYAALLYRKDRFRKVESGHFWLSETPEIVGSRSWDAALHRMASWIILEDKRAGDRPFVYLNTHWDHVGRQARLESAKLIRRWLLSKTDASGMPIIVSGDFNAGESDPPYPALVLGDDSDKKPFLDAYRVVNPERTDKEGTFGAWRGTRDGRRIDWILHSQAFTALDGRISYFNESGRYPSDHFPVIAVLRLDDSHPASP